MIYLRSVEAVYYTLTRLCDDDGYVQIGQRDLAREADLPVETVRAALAIMYVENYVHRRTGGGTHSGANIYRVHPPAAPEPVPPVLRLVRSDDAS